MLAVPLTENQIKIANTLHQRLKQWSLADKALDELQQNFLGNNPSSILLKAAAINQLYGTNLYAVTRMSEHIANILAERPQNEVELVEAIAALPKTKKQTKDRKYYSFASKFVHFFIAPDRIPIYDRYAFSVMKLHIGKTHKLIGDAPYREFVHGITILRDEIGQHYSLREIDRYLWLCGLYHAWNKNKKAKINKEVAGLFSREAPDILKVLYGKLQKATKGR